MKLLNELKKGTKIRLNGYHATVSRSWNKVPQEYQEHGDRLREKQAKQTITDTDPKKN